MKISKVVLCCLSVMFLASASFSVNAGFNDPWWLLYKVKGGQLIYKKGPYGGKYECLGDKYSLEFGHEFIDCVQ